MSLELYWVPHIGTILVRFLLACLKFGKRDGDYFGIMSPFEERTLRREGLDIPISCKVTMHDFLVDYIIISFLLCISHCCFMSIICNFMDGY
jgi:hypothetical protein